MTEFIIRPASAADAPAIVALLRELADYEKLLHRFHLTEVVAARDMTGSACHTDLAFAEREAVAIATWGWIYKSFAACRGIFLEDLYVKPDHRGRGIGKTMLLALAAKAHQAGGFLEWQVLDWNTSSIAFYKSLDAVMMPDWITCRLEGAALGKAAS
ncbi:MAG TPA: GNAT family N-acetyltransferase [Rhizomicrobium sp.]|jgi:diamine N-acetyltransferase